MQKYNARIVGFKWSQKYPARYYPIFTYIDAYGNERQYTRRKSIERTPFTLNQKYKICKTASSTYESTEKRLSHKVYLFGVRLIGCALSAIFYKHALAIACIITIIHMCYLCYKPLQRLRIKKIVVNKSPIEGKIVGYQKKKRFKLIGEPEEVYHPLIEYYYGNKLYTHTSRHICECDAYKLHQSCPIYILQKKKMIVDNFEIQEPIIKINFAELIAKILKWSRNRECDTKIYRKPTPSEHRKTINNLGATLEFVPIQQSTDSNTISIKC